VGKIGVFFGIVLIILIGFLPSFLFVFFFSQYGSPFANYVDFMSNTAVSWWAWIIAFALIILLSFTWILIRMRKNPNKSGSKKIISFFIFLIIIVILVLIVFEMYLYTKFLLGSDLLVKLSSDKESVFFTNNSEESVTFKISTTMNPFCLAECESEFFDVSNGVIIEEDTFNMTPILPKYKTYSFKKNSSNQDQILNRFHVICKTKKNLLCYTKGEEIRRSVLVSINYGLSADQKKLREQYKSDLIEIAKKIYRIEHELNISNLNIDLMENYMDSNNWFNSSDSLSNRLISLNSSYQSSKKYLLDNNLQVLGDQINGLNNESQDIFNKILDLNLNLSSNINIYNDLIDNLSLQRNKLKNYLLEDLDENSCSVLNDIVKEFNSYFVSFNKISTTYDKQLVLQNVSYLISNFSFLQDENYSCSLNETINKTNVSKLNFVNFSYSPVNVIFNDSSPTCCFYGKCEECCDFNCSDKNYPIVFLHGHSVNRALPADYSFDAFSKIKDKLSSNGYIDAGVVLISSSKENFGILGRFNVPVIFTASYYFDSYQTEDGEVIVPSKSEGIDTYSIRLKDIIKTVKERTGKDKVVIVAHSMGGLVTRRYVQIFGDNEIDKIIFITVPHHGIDGKVEDYCSLFGPKASCSDMDKNSILINKLNEANSSRIPLYNIIGIGCNMGEETGDGIVKNSSQYLSYATNYYISGSCDELNFNFLHSQILDSDMYPEAYDTLLQYLNL
jgi:hypothetical protein